MFDIENRENIYSNKIHAKNYFSDKIPFLIIYCLSHGYCKYFWRPDKSIFIIFKYEILHFSY